MTNHEEKVVQIKEAFGYLQALGFSLNYYESNGLLNDRKLFIFNFDNDHLRKRVEIVYCETTVFSSLYGYLINYEHSLPGISNYNKYIPFSRLKCFFREGGEVKFFGAEQNHFDYQIKEFALILKKFESCLRTKEWIDYDQLVLNEKAIYVLTREHGQEGWIKEIKENELIKNKFTVNYDSSIEPPHEAHGLRLRSPNGDLYHLSHGYISREDTSFLIEIIIKNMPVEQLELINVSCEALVKALLDKVGG